MAIINSWVTKQAHLTVTQMGIYGFELGDQLSQLTPIFSTARTLDVPNVDGYDGNNNSV